jgi:hypothetical protein
MRRIESRMRCFDWALVDDDSRGDSRLTWGYNKGLDWLLLGGSQVSKARPGAPFGFLPTVPGGGDKRVLRFLLTV